jgi:hypothetical protein
MGVVSFEREADNSTSGGDTAGVSEDVSVWMRFEGFQNVGFFGEHRGQRSRYFCIVKAQKFMSLDIAAAHIAIVGDEGKA